MGHAYQAVGWNRQKKLYDRALLAGVVALLALSAGLGALLQPNATFETLLIRAFGVTAFTLLHVVLSIGPLCRLDARFLPLLYNRRHLGVTMFVCALSHAALAFVLFHTLGVVRPLVSLFAGDVGARGFAGIPFQPLGAAALAILFVMAATSHDFWLANLTAPVWKALHMLVYFAYALLMLHVSLGVLQSDRSPWLALVVALGLGCVLSLHLAAAWKERALDRPCAEHEGFVDACGVDEIAEKRARVVTVAGERLAIFRYDGRISAVSNACRHQNGPLGEGRVIDGCITCPWHGYQYVPDCGASPAPFSESVPTFRVAVAKGRVLVGTKPLPAGTRVEPARVEAKEIADDGEFYVGYQSQAPPRLARRTRAVVFALVVASLGIGALVASHQRELKAANFEFGVERDFAGTVEARPYPMLRVARPGAAEASRYLLVAPGKHGADEIVAGFDGAAVHLRGSLVFHDARTMIEVVPGSLELEARDVAAAAPRVTLGVFTFVGEIVDSKCHLGVMNPGERRTHRACAKLCIRGGIPPLLWIEDEGGHAEKLLLVGVDGRALNGELLELVGERVEVTGEVERLDDLLVLRAEPSVYRRVDP